MPLNLWLLIIVFAPSVALLGKYYSSYDEQRLLLAYGLTVLIIFNYRRISLSSFSFPYLLILVAGLLSVTMAISPDTAALEWGLMISLFAGILSLSGFCSDPRIVQTRILPAIGLGVVLYSLISLIYLMIGWHYEGQAFWPAPIHNFSNVRFFNQYQSWLLPLLPAVLYSSLPQVSKVWRISLFLCYFIVFFSLLYYSGGRGTQLGILVAFMLILLIFRGYAMRWAGIMAAGALLALLLTPLLFGGDTMGQVAKHTLERSTSDQLDQRLGGRLPLWTLGYEIIKQHPFTGVGPMGYAELSPVFSHPHNFPLQFAAEWGLPAALLLFSLLSYAMLRWLSFAYHRVTAAECPQWERMYIISLTASLLTAGTHSLVSGVMVMPVSQMMLVLITALMLGWYRRYLPPKASQSLIDTRIWPAVSLAAALWLGGFTAVEQYRYSESREIARTIGLPSQPRYWLTARTPASSRIQRYNLSTIKPVRYPPDTTGRVNLTENMQVG